MSDFSLDLHQWNSFWFFISFVYDLLDVWSVLILIFLTFDLCHTEVLPLVEFVIDSSLTDEEAVQILDLSIPKQKKEDRGWKEGRIGRILVNFFIK